MGYAADTSVSPEKSRAEIERILSRYGAGQFMYAWDDDSQQAVIAFRMGETLGYRQVKFTLTMPPKDEFAMTPGGKRSRSAEQTLAAWEQATRQRWRALALVVKAKLEAVESGIATFDEEFLAHILLPNGETVGQWISPDLDRAYSDKAMPGRLQLALPAGKKS